MRIKHLLIYSCLSIFTIAGCSKKDDTPVTYKISEDFENGRKASYAAKTDTLITGIWNFEDALVGNQAGDLKNGLRSARLRTGKITMNFDVSGLKTVYISHGKFGKDANATWQLLMSTDGGTTFNPLGAEIQESNTTLVTDSFQIDVKGKVRFQIQKTSPTTRVNIDDITFKGTGESGIVLGKPKPETNPGDGGENPNPGPASRDLVVGPDAQPLTGDDSNAFLGNPSDASTLTPENYLLDMRYYTQSYSSSRGIPNWVSWHIDAKSLVKGTERLDNFASYTGLPSAFYKVLNSSYTGSGFDRGHNCPSGDRVTSKEANGATFFMNNMIPQAPNNNQKTWEGLESYLRAQVTSGNEVYIIMGSYGTGGVGSSGTMTTTIDNGKVTVPGYVWKIALIIPEGNGDMQRVSTATRVIAINTPNVNTVDFDWKKYIVTVSDIEKATGHKLLSNLPQGVQDALKIKKDTGN
jgi:endonuclease G